MSTKRGYVRYFLTAFFITVPLVLFWQRQNIYDWLRLRDYSPPPEIVALADSTTMNATARRYFYVNHPRLMADSTSFREVCTQHEQTIVLGCYHPVQQGIYIYDVSDRRLEGIEQVTGAHEMLHAAYDRLGEDERRQLDALLNSYFRSGLNDERIRETIESYRKNDPGVITNEMHSIFGTEITELPQELELYYGRYFSNRQAVVAFSQKYETEFTSRNTRIERYEAELAGLKQTIDAQRSEYDNRRRELERDEAELNRLRSSGRTEEYNARVDDYNAKVNSFNGLAAQLRDNIVRHNALIVEYNQLAGELKQLFSAIDSRIETR